MVTEDLIRLQGSTGTRGVDLLEREKSTLWREICRRGCSCTTLNSSGLNLWHRDWLIKCGTILWNWASLQSRAATHILPIRSSSCSCYSPESHQQSIGPVGPDQPCKNVILKNTIGKRCPAVITFPGGSCKTFMTIALLVAEEETDQNVGQLLSALETLDTLAAIRKH